MEFTGVSLRSDFINKEKILKLPAAARARPPTLSDLQAPIEQINLLYVALTRSRRLLEMPCRSTITPDIFLV